jgi:hypothetical protein
MEKVSNTARSEPVLAPTVSKMIQTHGLYAEIPAQLSNVSNSSKSWKMRLAVAEFQKTNRFIFPGTQRDLFYVFLLKDRER